MQHLSKTEEKESAVTLTHKEQVRPCLGRELQARNRVGQHRLGDISAAYGCAQKSITGGLDDPALLNKFPDQTVFIGCESPSDCKEDAVPHTLEEGHAGVETGRVVGVGQGGGDFRCTARRGHFLLECIEC